MGSLFQTDNLVWRWVGRIADLIVLNFLFLVCSIPVVTIGASCTAMYSVTLKAVKDEESYIFKGFLKAFKENFVQSTAAWLILAAVGIVLLTDLRFAAGVPGMAGTLFEVFLYALLFVYAVLLLYIFPYIARFHATLGQVFKNSALISIGSLPFTLLLVTLNGGMALVTFLNADILGKMAVFWLIIGFACMAFLSSAFYRTIFAKYEQPVV